MTTFFNKIGRQAPNMLTPKGSGSKLKKTEEDGEAKEDKPEAPGVESPELGKTRRRLSVISDNKLIEGVEHAQAEEAEEPEQEDKDAAHGGFIVSSYAGHSKKGYAPYNPRKKNQDALVMLEDPVTKSLVIGVLDGHGECGDIVAQYVRREIESNLFHHPSFGSDIKAALRDTIARGERAVLADNTVDTDFSGTTCVVAVIRGSKLTVANVGDSRLTIAVKDSSGFFAEPVSIDHKPDLPEEKARIIATGGRVFSVEYEDGVEGPPRVWLGHMDVPGLAMSRSLGDSVAHTAGVSSQPDFFERDLHADRDALVILATDGLWEFMTDQEVVDLASACTEPSAAVNVLIREANNRWMREEQVVDDTTVCVAFLQGK